MTALQKPTAELISELVEIVGADNALLTPEDQAGYLREWRDRYIGATPLVIRPASTEEVAAIMRTAHNAGVGIVPQGGNTGLVGGQIPSQDGTEIVVSMQRLNKIRFIDGDSQTLTAEAGKTLMAVQQAADDAGFLFPLSLASEGTAEIGGILATNAGGTAVLAYGNARNLTLGIEAVLPDGRIWNGLSSLRKDNTGYDLRDLVIGSEGTLAIITAATLKLFPKPAEQATAIAAFSSPEQLLAFFRHAQACAGTALTTFEFWCAEVQAFALRANDSLRAPIVGNHPWYALIELSGMQQNNQIAAQLEQLLTTAPPGAAPQDAVVAATLGHARNFWQLRDSFSEAQKIAGGSIKHDIAVPIARIPEFLSRAARIADHVVPGCRPVPFGHFGDGNIHYNITQPEDADKQTFLNKWDEMSAAIHKLVIELNGTISAEHGIGQMKRAMLKNYKSEVELDMMRAIKHALDPKGILNPGKLL